MTLARDAALAVCGAMLPLAVALGTSQQSGTNSVVLLGALVIAWVVGTWHLVSRRVAHERQALTKALASPADSADVLRFHETHQLFSQVGELRRDARELADASREPLARLKARAERRSTFMGPIGHEVKNPLNSIIGFTDMLASGAEGELNAEQLQSVETIRNGAARLYGFVSMVVDDARLEAGALRARQRWLHAPDLFAQVVTTLSSSQGEVNIGRSDGVPSVYVDGEQVVRALASFVSIIRHAADGAVCLQASTRPEDGAANEEFVRVRINVPAPSRRTGHDEVSEALAAATASTALQLESLVARRLVSLQGGRVEVRDESTGGICIEVLLPTSGPSTGELAAVKPLS